MRSKINEMNRGQHQNGNEQAGNVPKQPARPAKEDYIDFEEIK